MKRLLLAALCSLNLCADIAKIDNKAFFVPHELGNLQFYFNNETNEFAIVRDGKGQVIPSYRIDKQIRGINAEQLEQFLQVGYISVNENDRHEFSLQSHVRGLGGGPGGATAGVVFGKFLTYGICYGSIYIASLIAGPGSTITALAAGKAASPFIELLSNKVAIGCGILGGILTGPV